LHITKKCVSTSFQYFRSFNTADEEDKFYIGQVIDNDIVEENINLRWFAPTKLSRERGKEWQNFCFELELQAVKCAGQRQNGAVRTRLQQQTQEVVYANCFFGFSKLKETGGLYPEVQRQLRNLGLISGAIKRGSTVRPPKK
jgi:hypothetical protein